MYESTVKNLIVILLFWTLAKIGSQMKYLAYASYAVEVVGPDWRGFTGQMNHVYYSIGTIVASVLSYFFRSWRHYTYAVLGILIYSNVDITGYLQPYIFRCCSLLL